MNQKNNLICLIGIDGSGKTTIAKSIAAYFRKKNFFYSIVKCGANVRFATAPLYLTCRICGYIPNYETNRKIHSSRYPEIHMLKTLSFFWTLAVYIDTLIIVTLRIKIPIFFGKKIISDRFIHDVLVELMISTRNYNIHKTKFGNLFLKMVKTYKVILIDADESIAFNRKKDVPSVEHLRIRKQLYLKLASDLDNILIVNGGKPIKEVTEKIISFINN
jgi:dTMP kinase